MTNELVLREFDRLVRFGLGLKENRWAYETEQLNLMYYTYEAAFQKMVHEHPDIQLDYIVWFSTIEMERKLSWEEEGF